MTVKYLSKEVNINLTSPNELMKEYFSDFMNAKSYLTSLDKMFKMTFIGIGQAGGRLVAPASTIGFPTFVINSSEDDFKELKETVPSIPKDNYVFTGVYDKNNQVIDTMQGTSKDRQRGLDIAMLNKDKYQDIANSDEVLGANFVWVSASLGGGTGSGAVFAVAKEIIVARENYNLDEKGVKEENSVGLILVLPSSKDAGAAYRHNALQALQELTELIDNAKKEAEDGFETFGAIYVIDNEYFAKSTLIKDYKQNSSTGYKVSEHDLSNAYTIASLFEFLSFLCLKSSTITVDRNELATFLGTTGFLNIKRDIDNEDIINELNKFKSDTSTQTEEQLKQVYKVYVEKFMAKDDLLMDMKSMKSTVAAIAYAIHNPEEVNKDIVRAIIGELLDTQNANIAHPGVYPITGAQQHGLTTFLGYITESYLVEPTRRLTEEYTAYKKTEADLLAAREEEKLRLKQETFSTLDLGQNKRSLFGNSERQTERRGGLSGGLDNGRGGLPRRNGGLSSNEGLNTPLGRRR